VRDAAVGGDDEQRREVALQRAVQPGKALEVEHVHLVDDVHLLGAHLRCGGSLFRHHAQSCRRA